MMNQPSNWEELERLAAQLEVSFEDGQDGYICLIKHEGVQGMFQESQAGLVVAIQWLAQLRRMMELADRKRGIVMSDQDKEYANLQQQYGDEYQWSDHKRGERIRYTAYTGEIRTGEIIWVQPAGEMIGRGGQRRPFKAQYIVNPDQDTGMPDFVDLGSVIEE